jgi:Glycine rich protein
VAIGAAGGSCPDPNEGGGGAGGAGAALTATVPVIPNETLFVGVGAPGAQCTGQSGAPGGSGGGGAGGGGGPNGAVGGGGGGGASLVAASVPSPSFGGLLVVAAGGGGGNQESADGGAAGSPGKDNFGGVGGGGAGTSSSGGGGGVGAVRANGVNGLSGGFGLGGTGGDCSQGPTRDAGGGGGGGGYYGGGGGGCADGGGGGGSSFVVANGNVVLGPTPTGSPAGVSITYAASTVDLSPRTIGFGSQAPGNAGPRKTVTVTNKGSAPLVVSGALVTGSDPGDFLLTNRCQQPVPAGSSCQLDVRFDPQATGARIAKLTVLSNAPVAPKAVALSGTGNSALTGVKRRPAKVAVVDCSPIHRGAAASTVTCSRTLVAGKVVFPRGGQATRATILRGRVVFAAGVSESRAHGGSLLVMAERRPLGRGTYTLLLRHRRGRRLVSRRVSMVIH